MGLKNFRILTISLIFSATLNLALFAVCVFLNCKETPVFQSISTYQGKQEITNLQVFQEMARLSFRELVTYLTNKDLVEEGFTRRDLALGCLTTFHHFNLEKAISARPLEVRNVQISETEKVQLFPALTEDQFEAIIRYAYQEKWPLTAQGLLSLMQRKNFVCDESLEQAFFVTTEFHALQTLFQKTAAPQDPLLLLSLVKEGSWEVLDRFTKEQAQILDFSLDKRRSLLLNYLSLGSPTAAQLLLKTDFTFALKRLEDQGILDLLSQLTVPSDEANKFCSELLRSPRSNAVLQKALATSMLLTGEPPRVAAEQKEIVASKLSVEQEPVALAPQENVCYHVVKEGESLWKISRQYKVKVDDIIKVNELEKDSLYPGMTLKIP